MGGVFGGYENVTKWNDAEFHTNEDGHDGRPNSMQVYAPSRTVVVYAPPSSATRTTRQFRAWASRATGRTSATEGADTRRPSRPRHRWASAALSRQHCAASSLLGQPPHFIFFQLSNTLHPPPPPPFPRFFFFFFFPQKKKKKKKKK